jgi:protease II
MTIIVWRALPRALLSMDSTSISSRRTLGLTGLPDRVMMRNLKDLWVQGTMCSISGTLIIWGHLIMIHRLKMCSRLKQFSRKHKSIKKIHLSEVILRWWRVDPNLSMDEVRINSSSILYLNKNSQTNLRSQKVQMRMPTLME